MKDNEAMLKFFSVIHQRAMMHLDRELKSYHIKAGQVPILRILDEEDGITQDKIKLILQMDKGALAKTIKPLITQGCILRTKTPEDLRAYSVTLTQKGRDIMPHLAQIISDWMGVIAKGMTKSQKTNASTLLSKMSNNAFTHFEKIKS